MPEEMLMITCNSKILICGNISEAVVFAADALKRDIRNVCAETDIKGIDISICPDGKIERECFVIAKQDDRLTISAADDLGMIYGIYYVSRYFLGVNEFWFWNEQPFEQKACYEIPDNYKYRSKPYKIRFRGWFVNDEVLIDAWKIGGDNDKPWEMVFEALLRCGGNMTIPGTDTNAHIYCELASKMGLWITHHHAEPLGAQMFARAYPEAVHRLVDVPRIHYPISGTMIREMKDEEERETWMI